MKTAIFIASLAAVAALTGCGGGGSTSPNGDAGSSSSAANGNSSSAEGSSSSASGNSSSTGSGIVAYTCSDSQSFGSASLETKSGYQGDISYDCKLMSAAQGFHLNVGSMTVTDLTKVETINGVVDGKSIQATETIDYKTAKVHYKGTASGYGSFDCEETYKPFLPVTIASDAETEALMEGSSPDYSVNYFDYNGPNYVSTTCPTSYYDEDINNGTPASIDMSMTSDYTVKDDSGKTHKVSVYQKTKM